MKILYSQIKKAIPGLKASPREVGEVLTLTGFMMDGFEKVRYLGEPDCLMSFEIRQNRGDCLSVLGLIKEVAAYYGLKIKLPLIPVRYPKKGSPDIRVEATRYVKRALAVEIAGVKNNESPGWLKEFLAFYNINSINFLVDLSNYIMLITGYPSHLLDKEKIDGTLFWSINKEFEEIVTLDGSRIPLKRKEELILRDRNNSLGLAGIVGGKKAAISLGTKSIIAEMAIYDRALIRRNSRELKITTEASQRLTKDLDPEGLDFAMERMCGLILEFCGGKIAKKPFSFYPKKHLLPTIKLDLTKPGIYAGIEISAAKSIKILKNLRFKVIRGRNSLLVTPPTDRMDINREEDVIEEIIRMVGYEKIPSDQAPKFKIVKNITPKIIYLAEKIRDILSNLGLDEILSWPLTKKEINLQTNYRLWENIPTQNSVNEEYPDLRQSIAPGLLLQLQEYLKRGIEYIQIFEIGKVFGREKGEYKENEALGILLYRDKKSISEMKRILDLLLYSLGLNDIRYLGTKTKPKIVNPYSVWDVTAKGKTLGILYKLKSQHHTDNTYFAEINLSELAKALEDFRLHPVVELTRKVVTLDANVELNKHESVEKFLEMIKEKIGKRNIWSVKVHDVFPLKEKIRYTIRICYRELSDTEAKKKHLSAFGLTEL